MSDRELRCDVAHSQIIRGVCPYCNAVIGNAADGKNATEWNISAMRTALRGPDDAVRTMTVVNVRQNVVPIDAAVELLATELAKSSGDVDSLAPSALSLLGNRLSTEELKKYEAQISDSDQNLPIRRLLLGYYFLKHFNSESIRTARNELIYWIIRHAPDSPDAGDPYTSINHILDSKGYEKAKGMWLRQVEAHPKNVKIIGNAARFFTTEEWKLSEDLLKRAAELEQENPEWPFHLGHLYSLKSIGVANSPQDVEDSLQQFQHTERLQQSIDAAGGDPKSNFMSRIGLLPHLADAAFKTKQFEDARKYAAELLELSTTSAESGAGEADGDAIHHAHLILGRLALIDGDVEAAKGHLLASAIMEGSPVLESFGPNMSLARELLEIGERDTVLEYFDLCTKFWACGRERLNHCAAQVLQGTVPKFGANELY